MDERTAVETVGFIRRIAGETGAKDISVIFHGGEPLLAPPAVWRTLLGEIGTQLAGYRLRMDVQSNLWNLTDDFLQLFREHHVSIGTSLDGPESVCDLNRGSGYFSRTFASVRKASAAGCPVSVIATVTRQTLPHTREIARYFRNLGMSMVLHGALAGMDGSDSPFALSAAQYASMVKDLFPWYVENRRHIRIDTLDHFVRGIVTGSPGVCTFRDCLGMFLSVSPTGDITSCQRLAGKKEFCMGNIFDRPTLASLYDSPAARRQQERQRQVAVRCGACSCRSVCNGGCYYNALASGDGVIDPLCEAYRDIYAFLQTKVTEEMQTPENLDAIAARPADAGEHPLLRRGAYISLAGKMHPSRIAANARTVLSIHELGKTGDPRKAAQNLFDRKICGDPDLTARLLEDMLRNAVRNNYTRQSAAPSGDTRMHCKRNNCYVHVTYDCNLRCSHCYAEAGTGRNEMTVRNFERIVGEAIAAGFRQVIVTGGEPLIHTHRAALMDICRQYRGQGSNLVLRTNLTGNFSDEDYHSLAASFDQVVVSVDGSEQTHNARRGAGTYAVMTRNLDLYARHAAALPDAAELSLACVMRSDDINGEPGRSVRQLGDRLNVKRVRFRPLLPIGRASQLDEPVMCEGLMQHVSAEDMLKSEFHPLTTCGIGQNLYVKPDGGVYPCYAWCGEHTYIGNVFDSGLEAVLTSPRFIRLTECTVDTIAKCRDCAYRYLCGGACRAWGNQNEQDLNAAPAQCDHLQKRAQTLIDAAESFLFGE